MKLYFWFVFLGSAILFAQNAPTKAVPIPGVSGPVAVTPESYPFDAAAKLQTPIDLAAHGYVEQEFFVSGTGNVYDWAADGTIAIKAADRPYATRILVRRPADPSRFSGTVIVETAHSGRGFDFEPMWGISSQYLLSHGDAYVAITVSSANVGALKMFDKNRYANLSFPKPVPEVCAGAPAAGGRGRGGEGGAVLKRPPEFFPESDDSVKWDIISQVGALLKNKSSSGPLAGFSVQYLLATTHTPDDLHTYSRAFARTANLENGKPVYDGFLIHEGGGLGPLNRCGVQAPPNDPRREFRNVGVPVVFVVTETYAPRLFPLRREDSDQPGDQFRLYEIAGEPHLDPWPYLFLPSPKDQAATGVQPSVGTWPFNYDCDQHRQFTDFPEPLLVDAMFANLDQWVRQGIPPPRAARIALTDPGTPRAAVVKDVYGNAAGGVRTPFLDVPAATYAHMTGANAQCREIGVKTPFETGKMEALYGDYQNYEAKMIAGIDRMVQDRWLLKFEAEKLKTDLRSHGR